MRIQYVKGVTYLNNRLAIRFLNSGRDGDICDDGRERVFGRVGLRGGDGGEEEHVLVCHCAAVGEDEAVGWGALAEVASHFCDSLVSG
jgi:hypothetical protein